VVALIRAELTREFPVGAMGKYTEQQSAARQFYADAPRPRSAREECEELCDDARGRMLDEWAEKLMRNGDVPRLYAQRCAEAVVGVLQERDRRAAEGAGVAVGGALAATVLLHGLLERSAEQIVEANNSKFAAGCLLLAMGNHTFARSARHWAELRGLSHESAANGVEQWQERLGLPRTSAQKSPEAKRVYQDTNGKLGRNAA
jgi:hypothetical protein